MILFEDVMNAYIEFRKGGRPLTTKERDAMWCYVNNYIVGLSKKLFKQHNYLNRPGEKEITRHDLRVLAFYDFVDFAIARNKGARWILMVFKMRFSDLEGLLMLKASGVVYVDDIIKGGISNTWTRRASKLAAARRNCAKVLRRHQNVGFDDLLPCLVENGASPKVVANWRRYHAKLEHLREISNPLPLMDFAIDSNKVGGAYE